MEVASKLQPWGQIQLTSAYVNYVLSEQKHTDLLATLSMATFMLPRQSVGVVIETLRPTKPHLYYRFTSFSLEKSFTLHIYFLNWVQSYSDFTFFSVLVFINYIF